MDSKARGCVEVGVQFSMVLFDVFQHLKLVALHLSVRPSMATGQCASKVALWKGPVGQGSPGE